MSVDAPSNRSRFRLTAGQRHNITQAADLVSGLNFQRLIADRPYDTDAFLASLQEGTDRAAVSLHKNRKELRDNGRHWYKERQPVKRFSNKIKHYRRIFSRFDKLSS